MAVMRAVPTRRAFRLAAAEPIFHGMTFWRALVFSLMAALFAVSGVARAAPPLETPPCHETQQSHHQAPPTDHDRKPAPIQMAMNCCLGCMPAEPAAAPPVAFAPPSRQHLFAGPMALREGLAVAPELGPPRAA